jgi:hypothetical protein
MGELGKETADPSASLGMTKERAIVPKTVVAGPMRFSPPWMSQRHMTIPVEKSDEKRLGPAATIYRAVALSFVIPSEAEGLRFPQGTEHNG